MSRKNRPVKEQELQKLTESYGEVSDGDEFDFPEFDASSSYSYYSSTDSQLSDFHDKDNRVENNFVNNGLVNKIDNKCYDDNKESFISKSSLFVNKSPSPSFKSQNCSKNCSESGKSVEKSETSRVNSLTKRNIRLPDCIVKSNFCPSALRNQPIRNSIPQDSNSPGKQRKHKINITSPNLNDSKFPTCSTPIRKYKENQNANVKEPGIEENNKEIQKFRDAFDSVDTDSDGRICPEELKRAFTKLGNIVTETEILRMIKEVDIDRNGTVEFNEFVVMMHHYTKFRSDHQDNDSEDSDIYDAFKAFDHNGDGFIDSDEIKRTMVALGESVSDSDVMAMIFEADADKDGKINFNVPDDESRM